MLKGFVHKSLNFFPEFFSFFEGASQLAKYFLHKSGAETITNRKIQNITLANGKAVCKSEKGHEEVVLFPQMCFNLFGQNAAELFKILLIFNM